MRHTTLSNIFRLAVVPAAIALGASMPAQAAQANQAKGDSTAKSTSAGTQADPAKYREVRASEMIDMSVRNPKGENLGQISDMIVDMNTGKVRYAILKFDPGILQGEELYAVPTTELRIAADRNDVVYDMSEAKLKSAKIDKDDWKAWGDDDWNEPDFMAGIDKAYGVKQPTRGARMHRMSDLIGKDVNDKSGEKIGELEELIVNMAQQKVHYAVLEFDPSWASAEQNYAFPLTSFNLTDGKDELVLDITKDKLAAMKSFTDDRYENRANLNDRVWVADIDRYFITVLPATTKTASNSAMKNKSSTAMFDRLDQDKSGSLSKAEVKDTADVDRHWMSFDKNGDDQISRDEFASNYKADAKKDRKEAKK
ncbi:MAG TPA: PRC-barrel domain-containing protein [Burkholderiaceae bacterium]|nr:PRC-barrel domain-containing protein [Burkholderiaceae bacterium]